MVLKMVTFLTIPLLVEYYNPHTYWCGPPMNDSYQQGHTFRAILASESHWLQPVLILSVHW